MKMIRDGQINTKGFKYGSITLPMILFIIIFFSFAVVITNFSRMHAAKLKLESVSHAAVDSILMKFDERLYSEYGLMGVKEQADVDGLVKRSLGYQSYNYLNSKKGMKDKIIEKGADKLGLEYKASDDKFNFYGFSNIAVDAKPLSTFKEIESFKTSVLNAHRKKFAVEGLKKATKLFDFWKNFMEAKSISALDSKARDLISKLEKKYKDCKESIDSLKKKFEELEKLLEGRNVDSDTFMELYERIWELSKLEEISDEEKEELHRIRKVSVKFKEIKEIAKRLSDKLDDLIKSCEDTIEKLGKILKDADGKVSATTDDDFKSMATKIRDNIDENINKIREGKEQARTSKEAIKEFHAGIININHDIEKLKKKLSDEEKESDDSSSSEEQKEDEPKDAYIYVDLGPLFKNMSIYMDIFEGKSDYKDTGKIMDLVWKSITGKKFPSYERFNASIDRTTFNKLPSKTKSFEASKKMNIHSRGSIDDISKQMNDYNTKGYGNSKPNGVESWIDKMTIIDYAISHFTYSVYKDDGKKIKDISKNPLYQSEIEYIMHGHSDPKINLIITDMQLFGIRVAANMIALAIGKSKELAVISGVLSSVSFGLGYPLAYGLAISAWSAFESLADIRELHNGKAVLFFKGPKDFYFSLDNQELLDDLLNKMQGKLEDAYTGHDAVEGSIDKNNKFGIKLKYEDYMFLLMLFEDEEKILYRTEDVIQIRETSAGDANFDITSFACFYQVDVEADMSIVKSNIEVEGLSMPKHRLKSSTSMGY